MMVSLPLLLALALTGSGCAAGPRSGGKEDKQVSAGTVPVVGVDVREISVDENAYAAVKGKLAPLVVIPDGDAKLDGDELRFGVVVENRAAAPADAYWVASLARPGSGALAMTLSAPEISGNASTAGPEIYALMGRVAVGKVTVPAHGRVRFQRALPLAPLEYVGAPVAELRWSFTINERGQNGSLRVPLPRRESLHIAAKQGNLAEVRRMLAAGAAINARDQHGHTALEAAAWEGRKDVAALLLDKGADPTNALRGAASSSDLALARLLLARGAKVNERDREGRTPLGWAMDRTPRDRDMLRFLIENGADIHAKDNAGGSPYRQASADEQAFMKSVAPRR